jgi:hypothetical protein
LLQEFCRFAASPAIRPSTPASSGRNGSGELAVGQPSNLGDKGNPAWKLVQTAFLAMPGFFSGSDPARF